MLNSLFSRHITTLLFVEDVEKSKIWYQKFLGISPVEDLKNFASFKIAGSFLNLHRADPKSPVSAGGSVCYWLVDDINACCEKAQKLGGSIYRGPLIVKETGRTICQIQDPFGNVFGLEAQTKK